MRTTTGGGGLERPAVGRWRALWLLAIAVVLSMTTWFSATAVIPQLRDEWSMSDASAAWLTIAVQLGFVGGALVSSLTNLSDVLPVRAVIAGAGLLAAAANLGILVAEALVCRLGCASSPVPVSRVSILRR